MVSPIDSNLANINKISNVNNEVANLTVKPAEIHNSTQVQNTRSQGNEIALKVDNSGRMLGKIGSNVSTIV